LFLKPKHLVLCDAINGAHLGRALRGHHQAINPIGRHVKKQPHADKPVRPSQEEQRKIDGHTPISVQRVEIDAAPIGLKNGVGQEVVNIHGHCCQENQICFFPFFVEKNVGNEKRET
jgi:hypothetical protein